MASKPSVTMTLAGDERKLTESFDRVAASSKAMADQVGESSREAVRSGERFDAMAEQTDTAESRFTGFYDTIGGTRDALVAWNDESLTTTDRMVALGQAGADLAGGLTEFVIPAMKNAAAFMSGPLRAAMTFVATHPLLIVFGLLAAAVIYLIVQTDWFQAVASRVFNWVGNLVTSVFGAALNWVVNAWGGIVGFFAHLPERIGQALGSLGSIIGGVFKGAVNVLIDALNWGIRRVNDLIYGINVINPFSDIPTIPQIARLHSGGVFHAPGGGEGLALLKDGERVSAPGQGGGMELRVTGTGALAELINHMVRSGQIQLKPRT